MATDGGGIDGMAGHSQPTGHQRLKLGYKASAGQFGARELVEYAVLAEDSGFDSVVVRRIRGGATRASRWR
jgi:hypothetical protein